MRGINHLLDRRNLIRYCGVLLAIVRRERYFPFRYMGRLATVLAAE